VGDGLGGNFAARVNGMAEDSRYFRDATELERYGINPTVALIAGGMLVRAGYEYFADRRTVNRGIPSFDGAPAPAPIETFFGDPNASHSRAYVHSAGVTIERGSTGTVMLRNRTRFVQYDKYYQNVFPGGTDEAGTSVALAAYNSSTDRRNLFNQTDLTRTFGSGWLRQTVLVGAELGRQTTDNFRRTGFFNGTATELSVPFDQPTVSPAIEFRQSASDADNRVEATTAAVYIQDQVALGSSWQVIAGLRYDRFALDFHNHRNDSRLERDDEMLSPRLGLVFKPIEPMSIYTSYTVSHLPSSGDQFASLNATTQTLEPERFINREIGLKWDVRPDLSIAAALYRLDRTNTAAPDPNDVTRIVQTGRQRSTGHEITVTGNVTADWQVAAGYASQRATIRSRTSAAAPGAAAPLVPRQTLSVWNRYRLTQRIGAGVGVIHQTKMYAAIDNSVTLPGFTRVDAAAYLTLTRTLRAQVNVENLFDERYYPTSHGNNNIMPGAPRSVRFSLTVTP
jgi:catecholate siderophore receptor